VPDIVAVRLSLTRWIRGRPVFTERDCLFLFGHRREKVLSFDLWLRFAALWFAVVVTGFVEGYVLSVTLSFEGETINEKRTKTLAKSIVEISFIKPPQGHERLSPCDDGLSP
jgi:hypothetical protein